MVELKVSCNDYRGSVVLKRRITYVRGDSGVGKSEFARCIMDYNTGDSSVKVDCVREVEVLSGVSLRGLDIFSSMRGCVVIIDDSLETEDTKFGNEIAKIVLELDIYLMIINRVDAFSVVGGLDYSVNSILICEKDGIDHRFVPLVDRVGYGEDYYNIG